MTMLHDLEVRVARPGEVDAIVALERRVVGAPHWPREDYVRAIGGELGGAVRRLVFVATAGAEIVGFAVGKMINAGTDALGEIESVAVAEQVRRLGVGRALCLRVVEWCSERGAEVIELEVRRSSESARALYRRLGFLEVGVRHGYYRDPAEDAILMSRVDRRD